MAKASPKAPLVFLPGTLCTEATFAYQAAHLRDVALGQVIPLYEGSSIAASARWVLAQCPETFALVGFSQGAIVALEIMRQAPERVGKLCLISANPQGSTQGQLETWSRWQDEVARGGFGDIVQGFTQNVHPDRRNDAELTETIFQMAHDTGRERFTTQLKALASRIDSRPYLADITCSTLLLVGRQDPVTPPSLHQEMLELMPHATFVPVEDSGHYLPLEQPQAVTAALRYWLQVT